MKKLFIIFTAALFLYSIAQAAPLMPGYGGGTGIATTSAGNVGKCLQVSSSSPYLTWTIGTCGSGSVSINGMSSSSFTLAAGTGLSVATSAGPTITYTASGTSTRSFALTGALPDTTGEVFNQPFATSSIGGPANGSWPYLATAFGSATSTAATSSIYVYGSFSVPMDYSTSSKIVVPWTTATSSGVAYWNFQYRNVCSAADLDSTTSTESISASSSAPATKNFLVLTTLSPTPTNFTAGCTVEYKLGLQGASTTVNTVSSTVLMMQPYFQYTPF